MKILNLDEALQLYDLLGEYLPDEEEPNSIINFVGKIVNNIKENSRPEIYIQSISLMSDFSEDDLLSMTSEQVLQLFIQGVMENQLPSLKKFCETIGYKNA